ncbi:MAG: sulfurtransferase [Candidatus Sedimenticola endophacoides]|uniref:Sulfurtransferase n=1 Tax=Candidatus Sedimenticola endophacoides TaxID=2548426 RepID=A0A6N4DNJ2_9GAMM|nr:MAG: sulfurtransferase [Candidatus Sedimenticola endophacoides]OQX33757.1 MAG: sulfurtransferase [Candidatus Sedimenticola endophacoides]PUD98537.1 MAG: sulfurtransferase [Candidatus Sedimenticola endophacoides]
MVKEIDSVALENKLADTEGLYLLDIRTQAEVMRGVLPRAEHLPMHLIPAKMSEFPRDRDIVLYCHTGARSYHACIYLMQQGFQNVINLRGGILDWARSGFSVVGYA